MVFYVQKDGRNGHENLEFLSHLFEMGSQVFTGYPLIYGIVRDDLEVVILLPLPLSLPHCWN